ncbi:biotin carboxylase [Endozoicomonas montiporae]|uniref:Biotin carboxylase n=1 Tax=Endozoicomonas montiporae TaxID=1027273 RepID=A0A081MZ00_9GAMM|nr:biotin carboxylase [Endozoicomonas montiporae]
MLIANRGEIALRVLRALQQLDIASVAIYHHSDQHSPVVQQADEAIEILGDTPSAAHLDGQQIIEFCQQLNVDAVHPCYGFLSENAAFARALEQAGITFIGPEASIIELMGDKITSRTFVADHGFPVPPSVNLEPDHPDFISSIVAMGFPVVVKASAGGGGKGMSIVHSQDELEDALRIASSEAEKYFGDKRVYVEKYFTSARHIEVQVLGDGQQVVHLGERECSIQRRFQKVIEEAPSPALNDITRREICETARGIAQSAGYNSAGTVEFLYTPEGEYYFLEMNTRIQVEHPVTEMTFGVDLVCEQIHIATGRPLSFKQEELSSSGHAIECRICAEDAFNDFMPETGKVLFLKEPYGQGLRFDSSLYQNQAITSAFDPMLAKLIVHADTRQEAIEEMRQALGDLVILGVKHNADYLDAILRHEQFAAGHFDTGFIQHYASDLTATQPENKKELHAILATAQLGERNNRLLAEATPELHAAIGHWRN